MGMSRMLSYAAPCYFRKVILVEPEAKLPEIGPLVANPDSPQKTYCSKWRMIPALVPTIVCIISLFAAIYWGHKYFTIPPAIGILFNLYPLYLAFILDDVMDHAKNNQEHGKQNRILKEHIEELEEEVNTIKEQNELFTSNNKLLEKQTKSLEKESKTLERENKKLHDHIVECQAELYDFKQASLLHTGRLESIGDSLVTVNETAKKNTKECENSVKHLKEEIEHFAEEHAHLKGTSEAIDAESKKIEAMLSKLVLVLESFIDWKNAKEVYDERVRHLEEVNNRLDATQEKLEKTKDNLHELDKSIAVKQKDQEIMHEKLQNVTNELERQEKALQTTRDELQNILERATEATVENAKGTKDNVIMIQSVIQELSKLLPPTPISTRPRTLSDPGTPTKNPAAN